MDVSNQKKKEKNKKGFRNAAVGGFFVASSPFSQQYLHAPNHFISGLFSLHSSWSESMNAAGRIVDKRTMALFVKTKQTGYISVYYNVASQDKANYLPPSATTERFTVLFSSFCTVVNKRLPCFILIPLGSAGGVNLGIYLE